MTKGDERTELVIQLLGAGQTATAVSKQVGCSISYVSRVHKNNRDRVEELRAKLPPKQEQTKTIVINPPAPKPKEATSSLPPLDVPTLDPNQDADLQLEPMLRQLEARGLAGHPLSKSQREIMALLRKSLERKKAAPTKHRRLVFHVDEIDISPTSDEQYQTLLRNTYEVKS